MRFRIGPSTYRVRICPGQLVWEDEPVDAVTHNGVILICGLLNARRRLQPLLEQLRHMHALHYGALHDEAIASWAADMFKQLAAHGGELALSRLTSDCTIDAGGVADVGAEPVGCECGKCGTKYAGHQILTGTPTLDPRLAIMVVPREVECEFCNVVMSWTEGATGLGAPNGRVISGPQYKPAHVASP